MMLPAGALRVLVVIIVACAALGEQNWVDPFDMTGESAKVFRKNYQQPPKEMTQRPVDPVPQSTSAPASVCPAGEGIDYRAFYRLLVGHLWRKIATARKREGAIALIADVHVSARSEHILEEFVNEKSELAVQEVTEAFEKIFTHIRSPATSSSSAFFGVSSETLWDVLTYTLLALVIFCLALPMAMIARSNHSSFCRFLLAVFYLSWLWTWIVLYKKEVADRRAALLKANVTSECDEPWYKMFGHYLASFITVSPDRCAELQEKMLVDPWLQVTPVRALVHMLVQMVLEPSLPLAENVVKFVRTLCGGLPVLHACAAAFVIVFLWVLTATYAFGYRIRVPWLLAVEPARSTSSGALSSDAEQRLAALIGSAMERHHSAFLERHEQLLEDSLALETGVRLAARRNSEAAARVLAGRRSLAPSCAGDGPLKEQKEEEEEVVPETVK